MNNSALILAIETSGRTGSVAISREDALLGEKSFSGFMKHSAELFPAIQKLLAEASAVPADIRQVFITAGPGSFTGLRIAVTAAKILNLALKTPIVALDSLDVIAENASDYITQSGQTIEHLAVVLDAKKDYFYAAVYDRIPSGWQKTFKTEMVTAETLMRILRQNTEVFMLGESLVYHKAKFEAPFVRFLDAQWWQPKARNLIRLGRLLAQNNSFSDPVTLIPTYIRKPDAVEKTQLL
jgi:tRNA threonylcarbamoyladenosine biosynthesis protein TsaB